MSPGDSENYLDGIARLIRQEVPSRAVPSSLSTNSLFRIYAVLLEARGQDVTAQDVHNAWVAWMLEHDPSHPAVVPYEELPAHIAAQDEIYVAAIRRVAVRLSGTPRAISGER